MTILRRHHHHHDPRLGWHSAHDTRSLTHPYTADANPPDPALLDQPRRWSPGVTLDQAREGACVGFAWTQEALSSPRPYKTTADTGNAYAANLYRTVQAIDRAMGNHWPDGASVLAGAKAAHHNGWIDAYRWALRGPLDIAAALHTDGPVVIGIPWHQNMYEVPHHGLLDTSGPLVGGHCLLVDEYHPGKRIAGHGRVRGFGLHNSWGDDWGRGGRAFISYDQLGELLAHYGEACIPIGRRKVTLT